MVQSILVAFKLKCIRQRIQQDASSSTIQDPLVILNSRDASNPDITARIQKYLATPEGQIMKAEAIITVSETYLKQIAETLQNPMPIPQRMLLNLALHECVTTIQQNEQILNLMTQSKNNETF